jgi:hypothetical protein
MAQVEFLVSAVREFMLQSKRRRERELKAGQSVKDSRAAAPKYSKINRKHVLMEWFGHVWTDGNHGVNIIVFNIVL